MADLFALGCIHEELLFRNDDYVSPEKAKAIMRLRCVLQAPSVCGTRVARSRL